MSDYPNTPWGTMQRLKDKQAIARSEGIEIEEVPEPEPDATPTTASLTKKKSKKKKTG